MASQVSEEKVHCSINGVETTGVNNLEIVGDNLGKIKAVTPNTLKLDKLQKDHEFKYSKLDHKITREKNKTKRG